MDQRALRIHLSKPLVPFTEVTNTFSYTGYAHGCWGSKLWSLYLHSKHFTDWTTTPDPSTITFLERILLCTRAGFCPWRGSSGCALGKPLLLVLHGQCQKPQNWTAPTALASLPHFQSCNPSLYIFLLFTKWEQMLQPQTRALHSHSFMLSPTSFPSGVYIPE